MSHTDEYELIAHSHLADCSMFLVDLYYRPPHLHKELELILALRGSGTVSNGKTAFSVSTGDILIFDSGEVHELNGGQLGLRLLAIQISKSFCKRYCGHLRNIRFQTNSVDKSGPQEMVCALQNAMLNAFEAYLDRSISGSFRCMAFINQIFEHLLQLAPHQFLDQSKLTGQAKQDERIHRILMYLEEHFREPLRLNDIASAEGITETYLSHFFRQHLHITFQDYLSRLRVEAAMHMLKATDLSLTGIAYECGFSDPKYLNRGFKKTLGVSPAEWRISGSAANIARDRGSGYTMQHIFSEEESRAWLEQHYRKNGTHTLSSNKETQTLARV